MLTFLVQFGCKIAPLVLQFLVSFSLVVDENSVCLILQPRRVEMFAACSSQRRL